MGHEVLTGKIWIALPTFITRTERHILSWGVCPHVLQVHCRASEYELMDLWRRPFLKLPISFACYRAPPPTPKAQTGAHRARPISHDLTQAYKLSKLLSNLTILVLKSATPHLVSCHPSDVRFG